MTFDGWLVIPWPTTGSTLIPASLEPRYNGIVAASTNPFTAQQQIQQWQSTGFWELSVSMPAMSKSEGQIWSAWIVSLNGMTNVYQLPTSLCADFPVELTSDGSTPQYWRLKTNSVQWTIKEGDIYGLTWESRQAL